MNTNTDIQAKAINAIRFLSADMVQQANSGHPGLPMGAAAIAYTVWFRHLIINPSNPNWFDRDRFILSGGHGSALLYSLLHLFGYGISIDELKNFRQWGSRTPGHPEVGMTPGIDTTTGPLGQGFANGVGFAVAEAHLASIFNKPGHKIVDHYTYAIVTDGDLMEGVAAEAASLAGHLNLGKLIYLYDDNRISIEGSTDIAFTEDRGARFAAYGWHIIKVADGNNVDEIDKAIKKAKKDPRPSLIICRTIIGYGLPTRQGTPKAHGEPPGDEELNAAKVALNWPVDPRFFVPDEVRGHYSLAIQSGQRAENRWKKSFKAYQNEYSELASELSRRIDGTLPADWEKSLPVFTADPKGIASRAASGKVINALSAILPELVGGSADLAPSNNTKIENGSDFQPGNYSGRNLHFGVREHGMASAVIGMALHKGLRPFGATFFVFSDYLRPVLRISALSHIPSLWIFTHDSIGVGEDGPTHQPIEHLASLRCMPNMVTIRPSDANETTQAWKAAILRKNGPTALVLTRQNLPTIDRNVFASADGLQKGAYTLKDIGNGKPQIILMASGSEVSIIIEAGNKLAAEGVCVRIISFPSWELFEMQEKSYQDSVLSPDIKSRVAIEAGSTQGWHRWVGDSGIVIGIDHFGASAPIKALFDNFGLTAQNVYEKAKSLIK
jgi:transketolase